MNCSTSLAFSHRATSLPAQIWKSVLKQSFQRSVVNAVRGAACEGFWSESFPDGILVSLLESLEALLVSFFASQEFPLISPPAPCRHQSYKASIVPVHCLIPGLSVPVCTASTAGYRQAGKTTGSPWLCAGLALSVCTQTCWVRAGSGPACLKCRWKQVYQLKSWFSLTPNINWYV